MNKRPRFRKKDEEPAKPRKKRLSMKEQSEQNLLNALDAVYDTEDKQSVNPKQAPIDEPIARKPEAPVTPTGGQTLVYIDGENAFFQLFDELRKKRLIRYREDLVKFDIKMLLDHMLGDLGARRDFYYGAKLHEEQDDPDLLKRTQKMIDHKRRWIGFLSNLGVNFVSAGKLVIRPDINPITKKEELVFTEKGVDVSLAVDMTEAAAANQAHTVVLWSSDQDLKPAMLAAQKHGVKVIYLTHETRINDVMTGSASETRLIPGDLIKKAYEKAN